jgi:hypothetical protein
MHYVVERAEDAPKRAQCRNNGVATKPQLPAIRAETSTVN